LGGLEGPPKRSERPGQPGALLYHRTGTRGRLERP